MTDIQPQFRIGDYIWDHQQQNYLGQGQFGKVFKGKNTKTGEEVAVKEMEDQYFSRKNKLESFKQESEILLQFQSENIVKLYLQDISEHRAVIIMELCPDGDLRNYLNSKNKKLSEDEAINILRQLMRGLKEITSKGFMHNDIKPENALKKKELFKLSDFGLSQKVDINDTRIKIKGFVGTPLYMAPQILKGMPHTSKSDIWSIGMLFYELLFGFLPFPCRDLYSYQVNVWKMNVKFPIDKMIHKNTKDFILKCLKRNEDDRMGWDEIFNHPLIKEDGVEEDQESNQLDKPLYEFNDSAKRYILNIQKKAHKMSHNMDKKLQEWFLDEKEYDREEFLELLQKIDESTTKEDVDNIFIPVDLTQNDKIDIREFRTMVINYDFRDINDQAGRLIYELTEVVKARRIDLLQFFKRYDVDQGGTVDSQEFAKLVRDFFPDIISVDIEILFHYFDKNRDGMISFNEFFETMNLRNKKKDILDSMNERIQKIFLTAGKFMSEYNIDIEFAQHNLDDQFINALNYQGFVKFLKIFDSSLTELELKYAFTSPGFQVDFYDDEKLVSLSNISKVLQNPEKIQQQIHEMSIECQAKIEEFHQSLDKNQKDDIVEQDLYSVLT